MVCSKVPQLGERVFDEQSGGNGSSLPPRANQDTQSCKQPTAGVAFASHVQTRQDNSAAKTNSRSRKIKSCLMRPSIYCI